jgi:antitoxin component HigA of HigAB toxin-antitoxin module
MSTIASIKSEKDRLAAVDEIRRLIRSDPDPGSAEAERLEVLSTLVEAYEAKAFQSKQVMPSMRLSSAWSNRTSHLVTLYPF